MMPEVTINAVTAGATLLRPIYGPGGVLIMAPGTRLSAAHVTLLKTRGVQRLWIADGDPTELLRALRPPDAALISALVAQRFSTAQPLSPFMRAVQATAVTLLNERADRSYTEKRALLGAGQ